MSPTDLELIEQSKAGNFTAFEQLIYRYDKDVLTIASRFTQSSDDAKDIYQDVFLRVYRALPKFEGRSEFSTWLYKITTNVCLTYRSRKKKMMAVPLYDDQNELTIDPPSEKNEDNHTEDFEVSSKIRQAMNLLSPKQKLVFTLRHFQDLKLKDIAVMMDCAEGTVKKYLFEATQKMRTHLKDLSV